MEKPRRSLEKQAPTILAQVHHGVANQIKLARSHFEVEREKLVELCHSSRKRFEKTLRRLTTEKHKLARMRLEMEKRRSLAQTRSHEYEQDQIAELRHEVEKISKVTPVHRDVEERDELAQMRSELEESPGLFLMLREEESRAKLARMCSEAAERLQITRKRLQEEQKKIGHMICEEEQYAEIRWKCREGEDQEELEELQPYGDKPAGIGSLERPLLDSEKQAPENYEDVLDSVTSRLFHSLLRTVMKKDFSERARMSAVVGPGGGEVEFHEFRLTFPKKAVKNDREFQIFIDNNPASYPKKKIPIAPILEVNPHMEFDRPVHIKVRAWVSAMKGETLDAQVLRKERDVWHWEKDVLLSETNETEFELSHFSPISLILKKRKRSAMLHFYNDVLIQRRTGTIISLFTRDEKSQRSAKSALHGEAYVQALALPQLFKAKVESQYVVKVDCESPKGVTYNPKPFKVDKMPDMQPYIDLTIPARNFPEGYEGNVVASYNVKPQKGGEEEQDGAGISKHLSVVLPATAGPTADGVKIEIKKTIIAQNVADDQGSLNITQDRTKNTLKQTDTT